ncbi:hypothetical protein ACROYT_G015537 [Oculina patagonica]
MEEEDTGDKIEIPGIPNAKSEEQHLTQHHTRPATARRTSAIQLSSIEREQEVVNSKCSRTCNAMAGGILCSKLLSVDVLSKEKPNTVRRVCAIVDEQSMLDYCDTVWNCCRKVNSDLIEKLHRRAAQLIVKHHNSDEALDLPDERPDVI